MSEDYNEIRQNIIMKVYDVRNFLADGLNVGTIKAPQEEVETFCGLLDKIIAEAGGISQRSIAFSLEQDCQKLRQLESEYRNLRSKGDNRFAEIITLREEIRKKTCLGHELVAKIYKDLPKVDA